MDEQLITETMHQIQSDIEMGDVEALEEFLQLVFNGQTKKYFVGYLSEERALELGYNIKDIYNEDTE